jgi:recombinational DNA repair protein RecT
VEPQEQERRAQDMPQGTVISQLLRKQAEGAVQITKQVADQQQRAKEATRGLTQASMDNYMDLLESMFSFYQGGPVADAETR